MYISCFASSNLTNSQFLAKDTNLLCPLGFTNVSFPAWNKSTSAFIFCIFSSFKSSLIPLNAWFNQLKDPPEVCNSLCSNCLLKYESYLFRELVAELIKSGLLLNGPCPNKYLWYYLWNYFRILSCIYFHHRTVQYCFFKIIIMLF